MADHNVTLNYVATGKPAPDDFTFVPDKNPIIVRAGQSISFRLGANAPEGKIRLTFEAPQLFSTSRPDFRAKGIFNEGDGDVRVTAAPPDKTTYECELVGPDGKVKARSKKNGGGEILPDRG